MLSTRCQGIQYPDVDDLQLNTPLLAWMILRAISIAKLVTRAQPFQQRDQRVQSDTASQQTRIAETFRDA